MTAQQVMQLRSRTHATVNSGAKDECLTMSQSFEGTSNKEYVTQSNTKVSNK